jgi:ribosomal-protein-alanine N-acetyltransferase
LADETQKNAPGSAYQIVTASWRDLSEVREIEKICFPRDAWPLFDMLGALTFPGTVRFKAILDGKNVGFVAGDIRRYQKTGWIATICVLPEYRNQGIGKALLLECEQAMEMPKVKLSVRISNQTAISMYRQNGYSDAGRWPRYYQGGEDALVMEKVLG